MLQALEKLDARQANVAEKLFVPRDAIQNYFDLLHQNGANRIIVLNLEAVTESFAILSTRLSTVMLKT
jgi:type IV secretory pathway VirB4 component